MPTMFSSYDYPPSFLNDFIKFKLNISKPDVFVNPYIGVPESRKRKE
jgi:hypothetical protein